MVKINSRLLPIKAHFFFFMAGMGPILPQLSVFGKQIGIPPEVMGYITSILPMMYVLAKPMFGYLADYFTSFRKGIFLSLIMGMTLSYAAFYFIPLDQMHSINVEPGQKWNLTFPVNEIGICRDELLSDDAKCTSTRLSHCFDETISFKAFFTKLSHPNVNSLQLPSNMEMNLSHFHICFQNQTDIFPQQMVTFNGLCEFLEEDQKSCLLTSSTFWLFVTFMFAGTIGFNVVNSISDAICFDMLGDEEQDKYGAQRVWGTIGFGATALLAGVIVDVWTTEAIKSFTPALIIMMIFSGFDLLSVSKLKLPQLTSSKSIFKDVWDLITHPAVAIFLVFATIAGIIDSFIIYFMFWHLEEVAAETGYMDQIKLIEGCVVAAECLAGEVPFFFYSGKIIKKLGYVHCMSMCFFFYAVRLALISWIPNPWYLVGVELFFQGITYALCYTCIVAYASAVAPEGTSATVQGLMAGMDDGLGFSIGSLVGGLALKRYGGRRSFQFFALAALCTCIAHIVVRPFSKKKQYFPQNGYQSPSEQQQLQNFKTETKVY